MKLTKLYLSCFVCIVLSSFSERIAAQTGVKLGTTISNFYYTGSQLSPYLGYDIDLRPYLGYDIEWAQLGDQKPLIAPYVGVYHTHQFSKRFGIRPELIFTQKGVNFSQHEYERVVYKVKISYLEVPLSIVYAFLKREKFFGDLYLGGYAALKLNAIKQVANHNSEVRKAQIGCVENFDAGYHLGLDIKFLLGKEYFLLDFRLFQGLTNVFYMPGNQPGLYFETQKTKITGFNLTVGYEF